MGFVLAGGKSSRMGADKAFLDFGGQTLLDRALRVLGGVCDRVAIVGDPAKFANCGALKGESGKGESAVADIFPGCGPLAGIHAALAHSSADLNLMLAVDMPFVTAELLAFLLAAGENSDAVVILPRTIKGFQPLCAVYRREFCFVAEQALRAGRYKIGAAFSGVVLRIVEDAELAAAGFSERSFFNLNTPQDRQLAENSLS